MRFGQLRWLLIPKFYGKVKDGAYSKAVKQQVVAGQVRREERQAAKFEASEKVWLP